MARLFLTPINLGQLELQNAAIQNLSTTSINAITPVVGQVVFDTDLNVLKMGVASTPSNKWSTVGSAATGSGAPATAPTASGQIYFDTTNLVLYVSKGTASSDDWVVNDPRGVTGEMASLGAANNAGTSIKIARIDHVHAHTDTEHSGIHLNALAAPTGDVTLNSHKITNLADPTNPQDAATKYYVDQARTGLDAKESVRLATTTNLSGITYNATGGTSTRGQITGAPNTLDGVSLAAGNRILVKNQTTGTGAANGIYVVSTLGTGANGVWDRATDFDADAEVTAGAYVWVTEGSTQADSGWVLTTNDPIVVGGSSGTVLDWVLFSSAGTLIAGNGLTKTGNQFDVGTASSSRIVVNADNIDLAQVTQSNGSGTAGLTFVQSVAVDLYGRVTGQTTATVQDATTSAKGVASFDSGDFAVTAGAVSIKAGGVDNNQLANSSITITGGTNINVSTSPVSLGGSTTIGITGQVAVTNGGTGADNAVGARANLGATGKYAANVGGSTSIAVTHNLNSTDVVVMTYKANAQVECDVTITDANTVTLGFAVAPSASSIRVVVVG